MLSCYLFTHSVYWPGVKRGNLSYKSQRCLLADLNVWPSWKNVCNSTWFSITLSWVISFWKGLFRL